MSFISSFISPAEENESAWWFIFQKDQLFVHTIDEAVRIPSLRDPGTVGIKPALKQYLGILDGIPCYAAAIDDQESIGSDGMTLMSLRKLFGMIPDDLLHVAVRASLIMHWDRNSQFCGQCGRPTQLSATERAKVCPACGLTNYPRISPAVIVAVINGQRILLAHNDRYPVKGLYSVLAGFVEPGETFEECVIREVKEEVGADVTDIRYFCCQPWPFPDSLMIAFTAQYAGGEIKVDGVELTEAQWFTADNLPRIPDKISVARKLIDWFVENR